MDWVIFKWCEQRKIYLGEIWTNDLVFNMLALYPLQIDLFSPMFKVSLFVKWTSHTHGLHLNLPPSQPKVAVIGGHQLLIGS